MKTQFYNGQYECEGHTVTFLVCEEDHTVLIKEMYISGVKVANNERKVSMTAARAFQAHLRKFGYDKVS